MDELVRKDSSSLVEYKETNDREHDHERDGRQGNMQWKPLDEGFFKVNSDSVVFEERKVGLISRMYI